MFQTPDFFCLKSGERQVAFGTIKWFDIQKGYGVITHDGEGGDVICDYAEVKILGGAQPNQKVRFDLKLNRGRLRATKVKLRHTQTMS